MANRHERLDLEHIAELARARGDLNIRPGGPRPSWWAFLAAAASAIAGVVHAVGDLNEGREFLSWVVEIASPDPPPVTHGRFVTPHEEMGGPN